MTSRTPDRVVTDFLDALARDDSSAAMADLDENVVYTNVGLPTVRGKRNVATDDTVVLTERIDEIRLGPVRIRFWVCGRFEVLDGAIAVWRDYFDFWDFTKGIVRGLVGVVVPSAVQSLPPRTVDVPGIA